jgi:hypothetical protein
LGNNLLGITLIALVIIIVAVLIILHFVIGIPSGTANSTPTPTGLGHLPAFVWR